jgi:hypothetical protein
MLFKRINRDAPDQVFVICKNGEDFELKGGTPVVYDFTTAKNGYSVILPTTAMLNAFAGVVADDEILGKSGTANEFGKVQVYGYHPAVYIAGTTAAAGDELQPVNAKSYLTLSAITTAYAIAGEQASLKASSTFGNKYKVFIRAM